MTEMTEKEGGAKIRKGLSARREPTSYRVEQDIVIPAGTILRGMGKDEFGASIGLSPGAAGAFIVMRPPGCMDSPILKRVISS